MACLGHGASRSTIYNLVRFARYPRTVSLDVSHDGTESVAIVHSKAAVGGDPGQSYRCYSS